MSVARTWRTRVKKLECYKLQSHERRSCLIERWISQFGHRSPLIISHLRVRSIPFTAFCSAGETTCKIACFITLLNFMSWLLNVLSTVRENASFGRSDDVTILLFRSKIAKNKRKNIWVLGSIIQYPRTAKPLYRTFLERDLGTFDKADW